MSICAPIGVASFLVRAICPSSASSAIDATVSPTAVKFAHGPRPNKLTAANPTATRRAVTLFGVQFTMGLAQLVEPTFATALPLPNQLTLIISATYRRLLLAGVF